MTKSEFLQAMKTDSEFKEAVRSVLKLEVIQKQYYNLNELSNITGLSPLSLKGRRKRKQIKMLNDGNEILITTKEVERFLRKLNTAL
jgi:predicted ATP-binding protein involved in virulence